MKKIVPLLTIALLLFGSCTKDACERTISYETQVPIYTSWEELRTPIVAVEARTLENMGKIYFKGIYIFINEVNEGVHVVDNSSPSNPRKIAFIPIPGNKDMAVRGNLLYADSYTDLVVIDIANPTSAAEVGRMQGLYPSYSWFMGINSDPTLGVVTEYKTETVTQVVDCDAGYYYGFDDPMIDLGDINNMGSAESGTDATVGGNNSGTASGTGGSFARFTIKNDKLYAVSDSELLTVDLTDDQNPNLLNRMHVGWDIETIFPYETSLFLGSQAGMFIYGINDPTLPSYIAQFEHARACDPVYVDEDIAYITLRDGTECTGFANQIDIVNVENLTSPYLIQSQPLFHPMGLGVDNGVLFVCDDTEGLKIFDCSNPNEPLVLLAHHPDFQAYDVIPINGMLIMIGADGLYLYNYKNANNITLMGSIQKGS